MSPRTEEAYVGWIRRYIFFHGKRHPDQLTEREITMFLNHLATARKVSASTQNQALAALLFLYERVLGRQLNWLDGVVHAKRPERLPTVLSRSEVAAILAALKGVEHICGSLLYGAGLRLMELLRLRAKDVDFSNQQIIVRDGKGGRDRVALLPTSLTARLREHLELARERHERDVALGAGHVELPDALRVKYPTAPREWHWQ
jgi:integrase